MEEVALALKHALDKGSTLYACGNGGSAAMASHLVGELIGKFNKKRKPYRAVSLLDPAVITCIANDFGYDKIFSRQLEALGKKGDILVALSTSYKSPNIVEVIKVAKKKKMELFILDLKLETAAKTQEAQLMTLHEICRLME